MPGGASRGSEGGAGAGETNTCLGEAFVLGASTVASVEKVRKERER